MECPYCKGEMEQGWITSSQVLYWATKGHLSYYDPECIRLEEKNPRPFTEAGCYLTAWYCRSCNLLLANPPEQRERLTPEKLVEMGKETARKTIQKLRKLEP